MLIINDALFNESYLKDFLDYKLDSSRGLNGIGLWKSLLINTKSTFLKGVIPNPLFIKNSLSTRLISNILGFL